MWVKLLPSTLFSGFISITLHYGSRSLSRRTESHRWLLRSRKHRPRSRASIAPGIHDGRDTCSGVLPSYTASGTNGIVANWPCSTNRDLRAVFVDVSASSTWATRNISSFTRRLGERSGGGGLRLLCRR